MLDGRFGVLPSGHREPFRDEACPRAFCGSDGSYDS